jgi:hypothetical protein
MIDLSKKLFAALNIILSPFFGLVKVLQFERRRKARASVPSTWVFHDDD